MGGAGQNCLSQEGAAAGVEDVAARGALSVVLGMPVPRALLMARVAGLSAALPSGMLRALEGPPPLNPQGAITASSSADAAAHGASTAVDGSSSTFWAIMAMMLSGCWHLCSHIWFAGKRVEPFRSGPSCGLGACTLARPGRSPTSAGLVAYHLGPLLPQCVVLSSLSLHFSRFRPQPGLVAYPGAFLPQHVSITPLAARACNYHCGSGF